MVGTVFNPLLGRAVTEKFEIERVHRIRKPSHLPRETPRDVIVRFYRSKVKAQIWEKLRRRPPLRYKGADLKVFADVSQETLARKRILKPLVEQLKQHNVQYFWGYLACLGERKEGRIVKLRFPEELQEFCEKWKLPMMDIPGWKDTGKGEREAEEENQWQEITKKKTTAKKKQNKGTNDIW